MLGGDTPRAAETLWPVRHGLGAHAVRVLAAAGRAVGPLRAAARAAHFDAGHGARLHPDGAGADVHCCCSSAASFPASPSASFSTAYAYIADVTPPEKRAGLRVVGAAFGVGFVLGPALGGIAGRRSTRDCRSGLRPAFCLANAAYGYFLSPESLPPERRMASSGRAPTRWARCAACARTTADGTGRRGLPASAWRTLSLPADRRAVRSYRYGWSDQMMGLIPRCRRRRDPGSCRALIQPTSALIGERRPR